VIKSLPRTRLLSFLRADLRLPVRVWSMQHRDALLVARRTGYLSGVHDHAFAGDQGDAEDRARRPDRTSPYGWMRQRMAERMPCFSGDDPIWGWLKRPSTRPSVWRQSTGKATVLVSAIVPRHRILLSDFDDWHAVLNDWYLSQTEAEDAAVEARPGRSGETVGCGSSRSGDCGLPRRCGGGDRDFLSRPASTASTSVRSSRSSSGPMGRATRNRKFNRNRLEPRL
jgi:hypothetical protein